MSVNFKVIKGKKQLIISVFCVFCNLFLSMKQEIKAQVISNNGAYVSISSGIVIDFDTMNVDNTTTINNEGTINVQFKKHKGNFIPFEINSRFSGTTCIRAAMGFNEPELYIKSFYLKKNIVNKKISEGIVFRYIEEIFLKTSKISKLKKNFSKGLIKKWF